jgi:hypothetical protein
MSRIRKAGGGTILYRTGSCELDFRGALLFLRDDQVHQILALTIISGSARRVLQVIEVRSPRYDLGLGKIPDLEGELRKMTRSLSSGSP